MHIPKKRVVIVALIVYLFLFSFTALAAQQTPPWIKYSGQQMRFSPYAFKDRRLLNPAENSEIQTEPTETESGHHDQAERVGEADEAATSKPKEEGSTLIRYSDFGEKSIMERLREDEISPEQLTNKTRLLPLTFTTQ